MVKLCLTFCNPMNCGLPVSSVQGISQAGILEWVVISFSRGFSWPRDQTCISCISGRFFTTEPRKLKLWKLFIILIPQGPFFKITCLFCVFTYFALLVMFFIPSRTHSALYDKALTWLLFYFSLMSLLFCISVVLSQLYHHHVLTVCLLKWL